MSDSEAKEPLRVIIDRSRWLRGEGSHSSSLLRKSDGKMCCLGFAALAAGHSREEIEGRQSPYAMMANATKVEFIDPFGKTCEHLMLVNDAYLGDRVETYFMGTNGMKSLCLTLESEAQCEEFITKEMASIGIEATFVDGPVTT